MRNKGIVMEMDKSNVYLIQQTDMSSIGLVASEPRKIDPSIVLYDVEKEHNIENLKQEFIIKNFFIDVGKDINEIKDRVNFRFSFKSKNANHVNWVVQLPGAFTRNSIESGRIFAGFWRSYRVKEYINVIRCYKCYEFGHIANIYNVIGQICEFCRSSDHERKDCNQ